MKNHPISAKRTVDSAARRKLGVLIAALREYMPMYDMLSVYLTFLALALTSIVIYV